MSEQNKADAAIAKWKGRFSEALGNPSTDAWLAGGGAALLAYMLSGGNKKLKKNPLMRLLLSGGAGLAAIGGVNAWDRYKARKAPAPPQETFSDDTEAIQEAANTSAAILEQERAVAEQQQQQPPQQPASTQQTPRGTFSDLTEEAIQERARIVAAAKQERDRVIAEAIQERARIVAERQQQLFSRAERSANATSTQAPQPTRTSTPTRALTDKELIERRYGDVPFMKRPVWVDAPEKSRYLSPAFGAVGGWFAGGALDNKFMRAGGVYRGNPNVTPKTWLGKIVEHVRNPAYSAAQGGAKVRSDAQVTYDAAGTPSMKPAQKHWVDYQKDAPMGTGNIVRGAVARGAGAGAGALIGAGVDKYIANPLLSAASRYLLHK